MGRRNEQLRWQLAKGLVQALHLERLASKYSRTTVMAVFNLVNGDGPTVGTALSGHPDIAMMSFFGNSSLVIYGPY